MAALTVEFPQTVWTVEFGGDEVVVAPVTMAPGDATGGGAVDSVNGQTGVVVLDAGDVGADPAGTAAGLVDDLSGVTNAATARTNLGLGNVDNTSDANKPVSTAQQTALDGKAAASHSHSGADITSGTVSTARLGTGTASASTYLRGDQTWAAVTPGASAINDLTDVDTATDPPATDDVLAWDGTLWTPAALTAADTGAIPASLIDAKGDVIVGTAADTAARLAVGSDGQVLTADSGEAGGVKWAAAAGGVTSVNGDTGTVVLDAADVGALSDSGGGKDAVSSLGALTGTVSIDLANGNSFYGTLSGNTTFTMTGFTTGRECQFVLSVTQDSTPRSVTWPAAVKWPFGSVPAISTGSGSRDLFVFRSRDGGTTVDGFQIGKGMA